MSVYTAGVVETAALTDAASLTHARATQVSASVLLLDNGSARVTQVSASVLISVGVAAIGSVTEAAALTDAATGKRLVVAGVTEVAALTDAPTETVAVGARDYFLGVTETVAFTDAAGGKRLVIAGVVETAALTDAAGGKRLVIAGVVETAALTDAATARKVATAGVVETAALWDQYSAGFPSGLDRFNRTARDLRGDTADLGGAWTVIGGWDGTCPYNPFDHVWDSLRGNWNNGVVLITGGMVRPQFVNTAPCSTALLLAAGSGGGCDVSADIIIPVLRTSEPGTYFDVGLTLYNTRHGRSDCVYTSYNWYTNQWRLTSIHSDYSGVSASAPASVVAGGTYRMMVRAAWPKVYLYIDDNLVASITDSARVETGYAGLYMEYSGDLGSADSICPRVDNFSVGATLPLVARPMVSVIEHAALTDAGSESIVLGPRVFLAGVVETAALTDAASQSIVFGPRLIAVGVTEVAALADAASTAYLAYTKARATQVSASVLLLDDGLARVTQVSASVLIPRDPVVLAGVVEAAVLTDVAFGHQAGVAEVWLAEAAACMDVATAVVVFAGVSCLAQVTEAAALTDSTSGHLSGMVVKTAGVIEAATLRDLAIGVLPTATHYVFEAAYLTDRFAAISQVRDNAAVTDSITVEKAPTPQPSWTSVGDACTAVVKVPAYGCTMRTSLGAGFSGAYPFSFAETSNGVVLMANGIDPMQRWNPATKQMSAAGVLGPKGAVTFDTKLVPLEGLEAWIPLQKMQPNETRDSSHLAGPWVKWDDAERDVQQNALLVYYYLPDGTLESYQSDALLPLVNVRWKDATTGRSVQFLDVSTGIMVWNGAYRIAGTVNGSSVVASRVLRDGTDVLSVLGTYTTDSQYVYRGYQRYIDRFGNPSDLSPIASAQGVQPATCGPFGVPGPFVYQGCEPPVDPKVVRRELYRSVAGTFQTVYLDISTTDLSSTTFASTKQDEDLVNGIPLALIDDQGNILANVHGVPPASKSVLCSHLGRVFAAVDVDYSEGCVQITGGVVTVQGIGTSWPASFVGRVFSSGALAYSYEIAAVDVERQQLTLIAPYAGPSRRYAEYAIRSDPSQRRVIFYTEALLPESWPVWNGISLEEDHDELTGLVSFGSFLYIVEQRHIYRFTFQNDPATDGAIFLSVSRGCVNDRCHVVVEGSCFALDEQGVHVFGGGKDTQSISDQIQDVFQGTGDLAINWASDRRYWHAAWDALRTTIRWFVATGIDPQPRMALCYNYRSQSWAMEHYPYPILGSTEVDLGARRSIVGSSNRAVYLVGDGGLEDFPASSATRGQVQAATAYSLTVDANDAATLAPLAATRPVAIASGRGARQVRLVTTMAGSVCRIDRPWAVLPDRSSVYQFGGIPWSWRSGWMSCIDSEDLSPRDMQVVFRPTRGPGSFDVAVYQDHAEQPSQWALSKRDDGITIAAGGTVVTVATNTPRGLVLLRVASHREAYALNDRFVSVELAGVGISEPVKIYQIVVSGLEG